MGKQNMRFTFALVATLFLVGCNTKVESKGIRANEKDHLARLDMIKLERMSSDFLFDGDYRRYKVARMFHDGQFVHYHMVPCNYSIDAFTYDEDFQYELVHEKPDDMSFAVLHEWHRDGTLKTTIVEIK